jgi:hypothetical protein
MESGNLHDRIGLYSLGEAISEPLQVALARAASILGVGTSSPRTKSQALCFGDTAGVPRLGLVRVFCDKHH